MAEKVPQNYSNHTRTDPPFHLFVMPIVRRQPAGEPLEGDP